jgi:signal recognition particle subunit SRP72
MSAAAPTLSSLLARTSLTDHNEVLHAANAALKKDKADAEAQHARIVALLKLDRWDDALRAFETGGQALQNGAPLAWAYALYKCGRLAEAEDVAEKALASGSDTRGFRHVLAQVVS